MLSILKSTVGVGATKTELWERLDGSYIMLNEVLVFLRENELISEEKHDGQSRFVTTSAGLELLQTAKYFSEETARSGTLSENNSNVMCEPLV